MPWYNDLRPTEDFETTDYALTFPQLGIEEKRRTIEGILALRAGLDTEIVPKKSDQNILVASWNIKELGHTTQRMPESYFYIAEIINRFDLIAIQEVKRSLYDLDKIMRLLGSDWTYIVNDITEGSSGNSERSAYVFNTRRVELAGVAGEMVLWDEITHDSPIKQLKRTPYLTGFKSGWKQFSLINIHLHPGDDSEDIAYRREEVRLLMRAISYKLKKKRFWDDNLVLVGDFNLYAGITKDDPTVRMIEENGFRELDSLKGKDTNASLTETYDRFFFRTNDYFKIACDQGQERGDVFDPFQYVFREGEESLYASFMQEDYTGKKDMTEPENLRKYFRHPWRKNQLSDHLPIWAEIEIDSSADFLEAKLRQLSEALSVV